MKIAMFGATGMIGKPVAEQLIKNGHVLTVLVREGEGGRVTKGSNLVVGDLIIKKEVMKVLKGMEGIYISLSVAQSSKKKNWQPEREGIDLILQVAKDENIKVIGYLSSLLQNYQGMNGFDWWVFDIKHRAYQKVKNTPIPSIVFRPSSFMENFENSMRRGKSISLAGESKHTMYWIAAKDYGKMVSTAFTNFDGSSKEYAIQGTEALNVDDAAEIYTKHHEKEKLKISKVPLGMLKFMGNFISPVNYTYNIITAMNNYPEKFHGIAVWEELGKPEITLKEFAIAK